MSEAMEEIQRLRAEVERLETVDADRERHFVLLKEKAVAIEQQFNVMASERDRFCSSVNRLAEIVGLSGKQCFAPEAVERQAKFELATLRGRVEDLEGKRFPIQGGPSIPWRMIGPHDRQCSDNHDQTLEDLAKRGGLSPSEVLAVLDDVRWFKSKWRTTSGAECHDELERRRAAFEDESNALRKELEIVNANWDADRQELEEALANSVPLCPDVAEVSREMLQIVHAILTCDEKTLPGGLCQCTKFISAQFEGLRAEVKRLLSELQQAREDNSALKEYRTSVCPEERGPDDAGFTQEEAHFWKQTAERDGTEIQRLKTAAVECDFRVLKCPVLKGEDLELLDPMEVCPEEEADWQDGNKEVYGPGSVPGADHSREVVLLDQGEPVVAVRKGTDFGCDDHDARPHSRCYVCDGSGTVPGASLSHVRQPCETCGGTGNEFGPPFPMCHKVPECPNKECPHFKLEDNRCGRKAEDHIVRNPPLNLGPVDEKENGEEVQD